MLKITDKAKDEIKRTLTEYPGKFLRVVMTGIG